MSSENKQPVKGNIVGHGENVSEEELLLAAKLDNGEGNELMGQSVGEALGAFADNNTITGTEIVEEAEFTPVTNETTSSEDALESDFVATSKQQFEEVVDAPVIDRAKLSYAVSAEGVSPEVAQGKMLQRQIYSEMRNPKPNFNANPCRMLRQMIDSNIISYETINMTRDEFDVMATAYNYNMGIKLAELFVHHEVMRRQSVLDNIHQYAEAAGVPADRLYHTRTAFIKASDPSNIHAEEIVEAYKVLNDIKAGKGDIVIQYTFLVDAMDKFDLDYVDLNMSHKEFCDLIKKEYKAQRNEHAPNVMLVKRKLRQQRAEQEQLAEANEANNALETAEVIELNHHEPASSKSTPPANNDEVEVSEVESISVQTANADEAVDDQIPSFTATQTADEEPQEETTSESTQKKSGATSNFISSIKSHLPEIKLFGKKAKPEAAQSSNETATKAQPELDPVEKRNRDFKAAVKLTMPIIKQALEGRRKNDALKGLNEGVDYPKLMNRSNEQKYFFWKMNNNISADGRFILSEIFEKVWELTPENFSTLFKDIKGMFAGMPMEDRNIVNTSEMFKNDLKVLEMVKNGTLFDLKNKRFREVFH
jgi:hypothetical protein